MSVEESKASEMGNVSEGSEATKAKKGRDASLYLDYIYDGGDQEERPKRLPGNSETLGKTLEYIKQNADHCTFSLTVEGQLHVHDMRGKNAFIFFFISEASPEKPGGDDGIVEIVESTTSGSSIYYVKISSEEAGEKKPLVLKKLSFGSKGFEVQKVPVDIECKEFSCMISICNCIYIFDSVGETTEVQCIDVVSGKSYSIEPIPLPTVVATAYQDRYIVVEGSSMRSIGSYNLRMFLLDVLDEESGWVEFPEYDLYFYA